MTEPNYDHEIPFHVWVQPGDTHAYARAREFLTLCRQDTEGKFHFESPAILAVPVHGAGDPWTIKSVLDIPLVDTRCGATYWVKYEEVDPVIQPPPPTNSGVRHG
jgi:hypothetical protein